jgi:hypothetical protein
MPAVDLDWENIEAVLRAALAAHGGLLSYPLYRQSCFAAGHRPWSIKRIRRALDVKTWTEALASCGGRRGVTTPSERAEALALVAAAVAELGGEPTIDECRAWARRRNARWVDAARAARAAGYPTWRAALAAARAEIPAPAAAGGRGSEMRHDVA